MVLQNDTTRNDVGPILGALGALGPTFVFVALRHSKRRKGDQTDDKRKALRPTSVITWQAQIRPST